MECLFVPDIRAGVPVCRLPDEEARHVRALRLREGDVVLISNGVGLLMQARIAGIDRREITVAVGTQVENSGELPFRVVLGLGVLDNRDRFEFALEKAVELGVVDFVPLLTRYSRAGKVNTDRLRSKAIAAMKQARRAVLMHIHEPMPISAFLAAFGRDTDIFLADADGGVWPGTPRDVCIAVGPEGGFSDEELALVRSAPGCTPVRLANRRLRAETAAILATGIVGMSA